MRPFERGGNAMNYARHGNPTTNALEAVMTDIEGGRGAVATASGMSALYLALLAAGTPPTAQPSRARATFWRHRIYMARPQKFCAPCLPRKAWA